MFCKRTGMFLLLVVMIGVFSASAGTNVQLYTTFDALPEGGELRGNADISDNQLRLTNAVNSQNGTFVWQPDQALRALRAVAFVRIGGGTATGADGMAFSYSNLDGGSFGEMGSGSGLRVRIRTWTFNVIDVVYGSTVVASIPVAHADLRPNTFVPLEIYVEPSGACVVRYNYITRYNGTIAGWNPQPEWGIALSARTGGANDNHHVDSLMVSDSIPYLVSLTRTDSTPAIIGVESVGYRALFSEVVTNLSGNDFALSTISGSPSATIGAVVSNLYTVNETFTGGVGIGALRGSAAIVDNRLRLTPAVNGQTGSWAFQPESPLTAFRVDFDLYIGGGDGADGAGFVYSPQASGNFGGAGFGTGLNVHFDTYQNTGEVPIRPAIVVRYNGVQLLGVQKTLRTGSYVPVTINVSHEGMCTVIHDGTVTHRDVVLPGWSPAADWYMGVGANTGGLNDIHAIDNFQLRSSVYRVQLANLGGAGELRLDMNNASVNDLEGANVSPTSRAGDETYVLDFIPPTVTGVAVQTGLTVDVTFSEPMGAGATTASNYVVSGSGQGSLANSPHSVALVSGNTYRLTWTTGIMFIGGDITITVSNVQDLAGNAMGSPNSGAHTGGGTATPPDPPVVSAATPTNNRRPTWSWEQGAHHGSGNFRYDLNDSGVWTDTVALSFTPGNDLDEGTHRLVVQERDTGGNWSADGYFDVEIDLTPPYPPVVTGPELTNNRRPTWSWSAGGGDGSGNFRHDLNNSGVWTNTTATDFTPASELPDDVYTLAVQERDAVGNWSESGEHAITIDTERPTTLLEATVAVPDPTDMTPIPMRVVFSKPVSGFTETDLHVENATVDAFTAQSTTEYTFSLLAFDQDVITAQVPEDAALDAAGNGNEASAVFSRTFESARPTATLSSTAPSATNTSPIPVMVVFSVPVFGFSAGDIYVVGAAVSNFSGGGANYSFDLVPTTEGQVTAQVLADAAVDSLGARNTASNTLARVYDITPPTVTLSSGAPDPTNAAIPVTAAFEEPVYGFTAGDVDATNADVTNFTGGDGDEQFTFTLAPTTAQGTISVVVPADVATDAASNPNTASNTLTRDYDGVAPTVLSVVVEDGLTVLVSFDKEMGVGADLSANYTVSGSGQGTLAVHPAAVQPESASTYRLTWNPPNEMFDGGDITIAVSNVQDYLGNAIGTPNSGTDIGGAVGEAPAAQCRDITVYLSEPTLVPADIDDGSSDNIGIETMLINGATEIVFSCDDIASNPNEVTLTVMDAAGNAGACAAWITVVDDVAPVIDIPGAQPRYLVAGMVFFPPQVTALDNCDGEVTVNLMDDDGLAFAPTPVETGTFTLVYEAQDSGGNMAIETLTVVVLQPDPIVISSVGERYFLLPVGASATFAVDASGGVDTLGYQWKRVTPDKGLEDIPGANASSYTIDPITEADAGDYLCEVSDGFTTEHSDIFTLEIGTGIPAAGMFGLALAAVLTATAGVIVKRDRKR